MSDFQFKKHHAQLTRMSDAIATNKAQTSQLWDEYATAEESLNRIAAETEQAIAADKTLTNESKRKAAKAIALEDNDTYQELLTLKRLTRRRIDALAAELSQLRRDWDAANLMCQWLIAAESGKAIARINV